MSTSNSNPWGKGIGAWALEAEKAEEEERAAAEAAAAAAPVEPSPAFPSLREAVATKPKKKKSTPVPLSVFATGTAVGPGARHHQHQAASTFEPKGLTTEELLRLPTGPKERTPEEIEQGRFGGGFRNYGSYGMGSGGGGRRDDGDGSWGQGGGRRPYGGGFDEDARRGGPGRGPDMEQMPSRADENDNWAAGKRSVAPSPMEFGRRDRYQSLGGGGGSGLARADETDDWSMGKRQPMPASSRPSSFGSGFRAADSSDRWIRGDSEILPHNGERERPRLVLNPPKKDGTIADEPVKTDEQVKTDEPVKTDAPVKTRASPFGTARPREEVLAEKGVDWRKADSEIETKKTSRPTSSHSSRPSSGHSSRAENLSSQVLSVEAKPRQKVNPFGAAKPREVLLEEKGKDWRKIDMELEHRAVDRPESEQERSLKEEINLLKKAFNKESLASTDEGSGVPSQEELTSLHEQITAKERELELLTRQFDDKVKFGRKAIGEKRPGSGAGRSISFSDRPPSRSEESRGMDFMERPGSRGSVGDMWGRPQEDTRGFPLGREGGFLGARNTDRPRSRERW